MQAGDGLKIGDAGGGIQGLELAQNVLLKLQRDALDRFAFEDGLRVFVREVSVTGRKIRKNGTRGSVNFGFHKM